MPRKKMQQLESFNVRVYVDEDGVVTLGHVSKFRLTPNSKDSLGIWCRGNKRKWHVGLALVTTKTKDYVGKTRKGMTRNENYIQIYT